MAEITPITNAPGFDLSHFDTITGSETPVRMYVVDPITKEEIVFNGERLYVDMLGPDSEKYRKLNNKIINGRIKSNRKGGAITTEVIEQDNKNLAACVITGWSPAFVRDGAPFEFSPENAKVFVQAYPPIYDQINDFLGDRGNFLKS